MNYATNDRELLGLIRFLERFRCYLKGSILLICTDNHVLKHLFWKQSLSRREARWLETRGYVEIIPIPLKPGKIHVLGDVLWRAPHAPGDRNINDIEVPYFNFENVMSRYEEDECLGPVLKALNCQWPIEEKKKVRLEKHVPIHKLHGRRLMYNGKICVPRKSVSTILEAAHDSKNGGHFQFARRCRRSVNSIGDIRLEMWSLMSMFLWSVRNVKTRTKKRSPILPPWRCQMEDGGQLLLNSSRIYQKQRMAPTRWRLGSID